MKNFKVGIPETTQIGNQYYFHVPISNKEGLYLLDFVTETGPPDWAIKEAESVAKALNLHETLVAYLECSQALDREVDEGRATLEKYGWDSSNPSTMTATQFVWNMRAKALKELNK